MGLLDSIGNLGGLGNITKALDPGQWIKQGINSVLPKNMAVVGDVAGALFDVNTGNVLGAAQLGMDAMKDLPQATKSLQQQGQPGAATNGSSASANPNLDPSPPPAPSKPIDLSNLMDVLKQLTALLNGGGAKADIAKSGIAEAPAADTSTKPDDTSAKTTTSSSGATPAADTSTKPDDTSAKTTTSSSTSSGTRTTTTTTITTTTTNSGSGSALTRGIVDSIRSAAIAAAANAAAPTVASHTAAPPPAASWYGSPTTPPPPTSNPTPAAPAATMTTTSASTPVPATNTSAPAPAAPAPVADPATGASGPSGGQTISSLAQFNSMSDSAVRDAVIHGRISPELAKDQTAMMAIQQRMNAISEMNNLMTNMMKALHDMQMAVIQNVRV